MNKIRKKAGIIIQIARDDDYYSNIADKRKWVLFVFCTIDIFLVLFYNIDK